MRRPVRRTILKRILVGLIGLGVLLALVLVPSIIVLNGHLPSEGWDNRSFSELEAERGAALLGHTENAFWERDVSVFGVRIARKGVQVQFEGDPGAPNGMGLESGHNTYWVFFDVLFLNVRGYEPGFRRGIYCFTKPFRCDNWIF